MTFFVVATSVGEEVERRGLTEDAAGQVMLAWTDHALILVISHIT